MRNILFTGILAVTSLATAAPGPQTQTYYHRSHYYERKQTKKKAVERIGGGAAAGAVVGALVGHGKGAAIGAGVGAGAGALYNHHEKVEAKKKDERLSYRGSQ